VISSNSALVIHDLQYNDSSYQFSSNIKVDSVLSGDFTLKPVVSITANESDSNIGLIVGASIGGVIYLTIVITLIFCFIKKPKQRYNWIAMVYFGN